MRADLAQRILIELSDLIDNIKIRTDTARADAREVLNKLMDEFEQEDRQRNSLRQLEHAALDYADDAQDHTFRWSRIQREENERRADSVESQIRERGEALIARMEARRTCVNILRTHGRVHEGFQMQKLRP